MRDAIPTEHVETIPAPIAYNEPFEEEDDVPHEWHSRFGLDCSRSIGRMLRAETDVEAIDHAGSGREALPIGLSQGKVI